MPNGEVFYDPSESFLRNLKLSFRTLDRKANRALANFHTGLWGQEDLAFPDKQASVDETTSYQLGKGIRKPFKEGKVDWLLDIVKLALWALILWSVASMLSPILAALL